MYGPLAQLGRYEILGKIASGGMASVYRARMEGAQGFQKIVALKIMHPHLADDDHHVTMFMDEGRLSARFTHPNLVSVFDHGELDSYRYMAMEFHPGLTLSRLWRYLRKKKRPMSMALTLHILREALNGLDYAHGLDDENGKPLEIVHRDISPENILITRQGQVKVLDFGIALDNARRAVSRTGIVKGKISYMSPEQVAGRTLDRRTDIYATAVMAFELLTGTHLFGDGTTDEIRRRILETKDAPFKPGVLPHSGIEAILLRALSHNKDDRYLTAAQFRKDMDDLMAAENWNPEVSRLVEWVKEAEEAYEKELDAQKKRTEKRNAPAKLRNAPAIPPESGPSERKGRIVPEREVVDIRWFARVSLALFFLALLMELFGVKLTLESANPAEASTIERPQGETPSSLNAPLEESLAAGEGASQAGKETQSRTELEELERRLMPEGQEEK